MEKNDEFLLRLKNQFEESDALLLKMDTEFSSLDTWDSLTKFSITAFLEDDYGIKIGMDELSKMGNPTRLWEYISSYKG